MQNKDPRKTKLKHRNNFETLLTNTLQWNSWSTAPLLSNAQVNKTLFVLDFHNKDISVVFNNVFCL